MPDPTGDLIAASPNCFFEFNPFVAYRYFPRAGIVNVEVMASAGGTGTITPEVMDDDAVEQLKQRLTGMGVAAVSVGAYCDLLFPLQVEALRQRIDFARQL